ncbi:MAG: MFS transporter, partial [bacterium]|nr:MFS transporter [bacterium]
GFGLLYAAPATGAVLAGYVLARMETIRHQGKLLLIALTIYALATIAFGLSKVFLLSFLALLAVGMGDSISTVIRNIIRQLTTPDYIRGRMTSINMIFVMGGPRLGEFEAGVLAAAVGGPLSVVIGGIGTLLVVGTAALAIPALRNYSGNKEFVR